MVNRDGAIVGDLNDGIGVTVTVGVSEVGDKPFGEGVPTGMRVGGLKEIVGSLLDG